MMKSFLLVMGFIGLIAPYSQFTPWILDNGLDTSLLVSQTFERRISAGAWLDVIVSAVTLFVMMFYLRQHFKALDMVAIV